MLPPESFLLHRPKNYTRTHIRMNAYTKTHTQVHVHTHSSTVGKSFTFTQPTLLTSQTACIRLFKRTNTLCFVMLQRHSVVGSVSATLQPSPRLSSFAVITSPGVVLIFCVCMFDVSAVNYHIAALLFFSTSVHRLMIVPIIASWVGMTLKQNQRHLELRFLHAA